MEKYFRWRIAQWLELRWWKSYLKGRSKEEYLEWKKDYWKNVLSKITDTVEIDFSKRIIDLGCGPSGIFIVLPENRVVAVDPLIDEYEKQISFFRKGDYPKTTFIQSTIENFETFEVLKTSEVFPFDLVFCMNCINHVRDIEKGFDKLKEVCADHGTIILSIDIHRFSFFKYLFRFLPVDILHPQQYDLNDYKLFVEKRGLKVLETELLKTELLFNHYLIVATSSNTAVHQDSENT